MQEIPRSEEYLLKRTSQKMDIQRAIPKNASTEHEASALGIKIASTSLFKESRKSLAALMGTSSTAWFEKLFHYLMHNHSQWKGTDLSSTFLRPKGVSEKKERPKSAMAYGQGVSLLCLCMNAKKGNVYIFFNRQLDIKNPMFLSCAVLS